jgi:hypothetical protein
MPLDISAIPSASTPPSDATPSRVRKLIEERFLTRRSIFKGALTAGVVLGIAALDFLPGHNVAQARRRGEDPWEYWSHCADYSTSTRRANWRWCNPASAAVGEWWCKTYYDRHRTLGRQRTGCHYEDYRRDYRCWNLSDSTVINAWIWRRGQSGGDKPSVVCSDGKTYVFNSCGDDYHYKSVCRRYL